MNQMANAALNKEDVQVLRMPSDMADVGTEAFEQELTLNLLGNEKGVLEQIETALKRIEDGSYGRCGACGKEISKARLEAIPYAALCVKCASQQEERRGWPHPARGATMPPAPDLRLEILARELYITAGVGQNSSRSVRPDFSACVARL